MPFSATSPNFIQAMVKVGILELWEAHNEKLGSIIQIRVQRQKAAVRTKTQFNITITAGRPLIYLKFSATNIAKRSLFWEGQKTVLKKGKGN